MPETYASRRYSWITPPGAVTPLDLELIKVCDHIGQRAERRFPFQGPVRTVGVVEVLVLAHSPHSSGLSRTGVLPWAQHLVLQIFLTDKRSSA